MKGQLRYYDEVTGSVQNCSTVCPALPGACQRKCPAYIPSGDNASTTLIETTLNTTTAFGSGQEVPSLVQLTAVPYILSAIAAILLFFIAIYFKDRIKRSINRLGQRLCQQHLKYGIQEEIKKPELQDLLGIHTQQNRLPSEPTGSP
ncbi:uncharacterized protein LOC127857574 isoform X1 [Dreissena polymorpha]|uniref:uncharacterized protein LOC127857574 isoform X1 n=1 Tax=Dreissena polymorpha TaxID=45954 RepID=UPI0022655314|nr:uncharacterized protein LOC127857574 isoform X1 [Dreissena polymorpha]